MTRKRLIDDTPTSKVQGVFIGLTELKGTAESETPFTSYLANIRCVQYAWRAEENWSRTVTETYRDAKGHTQTRTRTESGWTVVAKGGESGSFYLKDDTDVVRIVPGGASIQNVTTFNKTCAPNDSLYFSKAPVREIANSTHRRRFEETAIPLHTPLYVMGQARERQDAVAAEIAYDKQSPMFIISTRTEKQVSSGYLGWTLMWLILGLTVVAVGAWLWGVFTGADVQWQAFAVAVAGYLLALALGWMWMVYNSLVNLRQRVRQGWSQVDVQLKRRHDLIPTLVQMAGGYKSYEAEVQRLVTELRGQMEATPPGVAGPDFKGLLPQLRVMVERYPELKASEQFLKLQQALTETEQRIALARDYFNNSATFFNTRLEVIPDRFVAAMLQLKMEPLMGAGDFERARVQVNLES